MENNTTPETPEQAPKNTSLETELTKAQAEVIRLGKLVNSYAEKEKKTQEEEARKKWEFERLFNEKSTEVEHLATSNKDLTTKNELYEDYFKKHYEVEVEKLSDEQKTLVHELLNGKSDFEKFSLLPKIVSQISPKNTAFGGTPQGGTPPEKTSDDKTLIKEGRFTELLKKRNGGVYNS